MVLEGVTIDSAHIDKLYKSDLIPLFIRANRKEHVLMYYDRDTAEHAALAVVGLSVDKAHKYLKDITPKELLLVSLLKGNRF